MKELNYSNVCDDVINNKNITVITGGLRNKCYLYQKDNTNLFIKVYNKDTKFSKHMSKSRCESEYGITKYLYDNGCNVAKPLFYSADKQIGIYEYVESMNVKTFGKLNMSLCYKVMDEISKVHKTPVVDEINGCHFYNLDSSDIYRYLSDGIDFLCDLRNVENCYKDLELYKRVVDTIGKSNRVFGNTQLHDGNVLISSKNEVMFCDFEKVCPHYPHMDIMSFIHCRKLDIEEEKKIIDYYIDINSITDRGLFYTIYNLLFIIDCLRILKKIKYNSEGLKVKWVDIEGKKTKTFEKTDSDQGLRWNKDRGESIEMRLDEICNKIYSDDDICNDLRFLVKKIIEDKDTNVA